MGTVHNGTVPIFSVADIKNRAQHAVPFILIVILNSIQDLVIAL